MPGAAVAMKSAVGRVGLAGSFRASEGRSGGTMGQGSAAFLLTN